MYDNIGRKIKTLAKVDFIVLTILSVIAGIILIASDEDLILTALLVFVLGPLVAWISSLLTFGFGELIEKVSSIEKSTHTVDNNPYEKLKEKNEKQQKLEQLYSQGLITEEEYLRAQTK